MDWTALLKSELEDAYRATEGLMDMVDNDALDWKPRDGDNWMTTGALLRHLTDACGWCCEQFVNDSWAEAMSAGGMDETPYTSTDEAKAGLANDKKRAFACVDQAGEEALEGRLTAAPWDPTERPLGQQLLQMVTHLQQHKSQLFYYLKLQGKQVNTFHMWGMPEPSGS